MTVVWTSDRQYLHCDSDSRSAWMLSITKLVQERVLRAWGAPSFFGTILVHGALDFAYHRGQLGLCVKFAHGASTALLNHRDLWTFPDLCRGLHRQASGIRDYEQS